MIRRGTAGTRVRTLALMAEVREKMAGAELRELGRGQFGDGWVTVPPEVGVKPGDRLLAVRGSRYGLGFVARGPIYEEAVKHPELEVFGEVQ